MDFTELDLPRVDVLVQFRAQSPHSLSYLLTMPAGRRYYGRGNVSLHSAAEIRGHFSDAKF